MASTEKVSPLNQTKARKMALQIISHHFGTKPRRIEQQTAGLSNFVFLVKHKTGDFVVRISPDPEKINAFIKEQWVVSKVREIGVPAPEILEVGIEVVPVPYMVSHRVNGTEASLHPNRMEILSELGRYAALINSIRTTGFGSTFDWSNNQLSRHKTWRDFLDKELKLDERLQILKKHDMLSTVQLKKLRSALLVPTKVPVKPTLNHGDLRLKNVIVDEQSKINAIIDWENCTSNIAPCWELSLALHDLGIDEKQKFLEGYGLKEKKLREFSLCMKAINIINYAPHLERLVARKDSARLEQYRTRLSGALDLHSLC